MARRYLFLCPEVHAASGGVAVIYDCVHELNLAGYRAAVLHEKAGVRYVNTRNRPPIHTTSFLRRAEAHRWFASRKPRLVWQALMVGPGLLLSRLRRGGDDLGPFGPQDVVVVPEFLWDYAVRTAPDQPKVLLSQNSFAHFNAYRRAIALGDDPDAGLVHAIGISRTCLDAIAMLTKRDVSHVVVCPNLSLFDYAAAKRPQIAYMPRKRPDEAALIDQLLRGRGLIDGYDLVAIDGKPQAEVARILRDSLFFISFMKCEALGFPALEAMAAGCVVIGYTGLGTEEYFDATTGIPVAEGDTAALVASVEAAVAAHKADPTRFDPMRQRAAERVRSGYSEDRFRTSLRAAWEKIDKTVEANAGPARNG